jgi:outer membrane protein insertion porin family
MGRLLIAIASLLLTLPSAVLGQEQSHPATRLQDVRFAGVSELNLADLDRCARELKAQTYRGSEWLNEVAERARILCWQSRGFFKAKVTPEAQQLPNDNATQQYDVNLTVDEGLQYRLGGIAFENNKVFPSEQLRGAVPLTNGDIFSAEAIRHGIEKLRRLYGESGYINMTSVPDTLVDDEQRLIWLKWDIDEGRQFRVSSIDFAGAPVGLEPQLKANAPINIGNIYNSTALDQYVAQLSAALRRCLSIEDDVIVRSDSQHATVSITFQLAGENVPCAQH